MVCVYGRRFCWVGVNGSVICVSSSVVLGFGVFFGRGCVGYYFAG